MHDRTNNTGEYSSHNSEPRQHEHLRWVIKYLVLADTALGLRKDDAEQQQPAP